MFHIKPTLRVIKYNSKCVSWYFRWNFVESIFSYLSISLGICIYTKKNPDYLFIGRVCCWFRRYLNEVRWKCDFLARILQFISFSRSFPTFLVFCFSFAFSLEAREILAWYWKSFAFRFFSFVLVRIHTNTLIVNWEILLAKKVQTIDFIVSQWAVFLRVPNCNILLCTLRRNPAKSCQCFE